jgi:carbamoylphosphate synthase small subunit
MTLKINRVSDSLKDEVCTKFGLNPLKDVDSRVFTRMLRKDGSVTIFLRNFVGEGIKKVDVERRISCLSISHGLFRGARCEH